MSHLIRIYAALTFCFSALHINFFPIDRMLKKQSRQQMYSEIWSERVKMLFAKN